MGAVRTGRLVSAVLDPVLVPAGFQAGQYGEGGDDRDGDAQIIFCAGHEEFSIRHSRLPQANQQEPGGTCVDLVVEVRADGTLAGLDLEGTSIEETLRHVGLTADSEAVAKVEGLSMTKGLPVIEAALRRLFV
ncbi:hypothetical protein [Nocardioides antri]|uniref:Uncharacterized protein n=1 Tax=Nocardioides antri TaxID=2607659 RepID=A0A5B1LTW8_9ACTN|nr:hypothetical protein [Nocardioides antri]KAA1424112.1 hypothetical protein F0U47_19665 [Nocardioides antri]